MNDAAFYCPDCGKSVGAHLDESGQRRPAPCWRCKRRTLQRAVAKRKRETPRALMGVDVDAAVADIRTTPVLADLLGRKKITVDVGHCMSGGCGGRAWRRRRKIRVYSGPEASVGRVLEVVLHELCHLAVDDHGHGERFRRVFARAVREAWGVEVPIDVDRGAYQNISYAMGERVWKALDELISAGCCINTYPAAPPKPETPRAERTAALVEKRAAHAAKMLAQAERRLKIAKTVHQRWRAKVSYYDRVAAKRSS